MTGFRACLDPVHRTKGATTWSLTHEIRARACAAAHPLRSCEPRTPPRRPHDALDEIAVEWARARAETAKLNIELREDALLARSRLDVPLDQSWVARRRRGVDGHV